MAPASLMQPNAPPWPRRLRRMEWIAWALALVLGATWALTRGLGWLSARRSLEAFAVASVPVASSGGSRAVARLELPASVDQSLWDKARIRAYAVALRRSAPPPLAVLRIPRLHLEVPVLEGTDEWTLDRAAGHVEGTARPGETGNVAIAGHRDGFFRVLKDIQVGDELALAVPGAVRRYRVERLSITDPEDVSPLDPAPTTRLTLVTCFPFYYVGPAPQRFIVHAVPSDENGQLEAGVMR